MSQDLSFIRNELIDYIEVKLPYQFMKNCPIKYITLKNEEEYFYKGGEFITEGNDSLLITNKARSWHVPTCYRNKDGTIKYESRFFIPDKEEVSTLPNEKEIKKLLDTIDYQQSIIEKVTNQLKEIELHKHSLQENNSQYEELLQQNRYHLKDLSLELRANKKTIKKYEDIIKKLTQSHPLMK
jgi:chromosome segregation ATPase